MRVSIRMLNLTLKELRSIAKSRNIDGYKYMSKGQLVNLITTDKLSPTPIPTFKKVEHITNISTRKLITVVI